MKISFYLRRHPFGVDEEDVILRGLESHQRDCLPLEQRLEYYERKIAEILFEERDYTIK